MPCNGTAHFYRLFCQVCAGAVIFNERSHTAAPWDFRIYFLSSRLASPPSSCMMSFGMLTSSVCECSSFIVVDLSICRFLPTYAGPFWCADELAEPPQYCGLWVKIHHSKTNTLSIYSSIMQYQGLWEIPPTMPVHRSSLPRCSAVGASRQRVHLPLNIPL